MLDLPVPAHKGLAAIKTAHQFEIVYNLPSSTTFLWQSVDSPPPELPVKPLQFRQTWRLPPGVSPLAESKFRKLPGSGEGYEADDWRTRVAAALPQTWHENRPAATVQMQALLDASLALRKGRAGQTLPLHEVLQVVQSQSGKEIHDFVVDSLALEEALIGPETLVRIPAFDGNLELLPWEALGLVIVPARTALLVTTRRQWEAWPTAAVDSLDMPEAVDAAVAEATANGHDATDRFRLALEWTSISANGISMPAGHSLVGLLSPAPALMSWTEWEALPGTDPAAAAQLVRSNTVAATGVLLATMLLLAWWLFAWPSSGRR